MFKILSATAIALLVGSFAHATGFEKHWSGKGEVVTSDGEKSTCKVDLDIRNSQSNFFHLSGGMDCGDITGDINLFGDMVNGRLIVDGTDVGSVTPTEVTAHVENKDIPLNFDYSIQLQGSDLHFRYSFSSPSNRNFEALTATLK